MRGRRGGSSTAETTTGRSHPDRTPSPTPHPTQPKPRARLGARWRSSFPTCPHSRSDHRHFLGAGAVLSEREKIDYVGASRAVPDCLHQTRRKGESSNMGWLAVVPSKASLK